MARTLPPRNRGQFIPRGRADSCPLLHLMLTPHRSAPHVKGWETRRAREAARRAAVLAALQAEIAARKENA